MDQPVHDKLATLSNALKGVIAPALTPFNDDLSVAEDLYLAHAKWLLKDGCVGLAPFGTTGEALSVGIDERNRMLDLLVDDGIDPAKLIPGTGLTNLPDTVKLTRKAVDLGCAGAMILPPFYFKNVADEGLYIYFKKLIEMVDRDALRIYLYHIPQVAGVGFPIEVVQRLREDFPRQIVGIKDSSGVWENTEALLHIDGLIVYPGAELPLIEALDLGGPGCISATANLNAAGIAGVIRAYHAGDRDKAVELHEDVKKFRLTMQEYAPIPAQKRLLAGWGDKRWANVRPPFLAMPEADGQALAARLKDEFGIDGLRG
ncbi:MAG TPA: dihydrodipicolinate synthase family protein [Afifellaceae bacterium]|nr:dihydrodipicolinate synthase family protein [Afifellaceae bacterium]